MDSTRNNIRTTEGSLKMRLSNRDEAVCTQPSYYVVLAPFAFASAGLEVDPGQPSHFLPVFTSREEADAWNEPGYPVIRLGSPSEMTEGNPRGTAEFWRRAQAVEQARDEYRHSYHDSLIDPRD